MRVPDRHEDNCLRETVRFLQKIREVAGDRFRARFSATARSKSLV